MLGLESLQFHSLLYELFLQLVIVQEVFWVDAAFSLRLQNLNTALLAELLNSFLQLIDLDLPGFNDLAEMGCFVEGRFSLFHFYIT